MKIKDFMIPDVISVKEQTTVKELLELLVEKKIGGVPVVNEDNTLVGVISDGDVIRYLKPNSRAVFDMFAIIMVNEQENLLEKLSYTLSKSVSNMMKTRDIITLHPDNKLEDAFSIFAKYHFKKIPITDENKRVVGVISRGDLLRHVTNTIIQKQ
ncbi:CBS domain-containing protein [Ornithinibacillus halotolerans]|uniref:CBS domain-containing protein n=1 Tax=Ornithinibacillus halotolerans TaxID=1274357 RepID=A0A916W2G5_9BACI|nr:CBS domain-containing protein [Ornithinibacillus halotolerans]GGA62091.1 CBS domain-containing protein [Ornithinibacillus halotolerans]